MAINESIRKQLPEGAIILEDKAYDNSIIGTTFDGRLIYCYEMMIEELQADDKMTEEEAAEWVTYNTMRALPYMGSKAPLIVFAGVDEIEL